MTTKIHSKFASSGLFFLAVLLTGVLTVLSLVNIWTKQTSKPTYTATKTSRGFLADKQKALNFYCVFSLLYDVLNPFFYTQVMRAEIVNKIQSGKNLSVLDAGCGTGYTTLGVLHSQGISEVTCLDMNPVQLKKAAKNLAAYGAKLALSRGDVENLPFVDESFDAVISVGAVEYFPHPEVALEEFTRVTKVNGVVAVGGPFSEWFSKFALNRLFYTLSSNDLESFFIKAGLSHVESFLTGVNTFFGTSKYVLVAVGKKS